ncbi:hypothetical protein ARMGADRAFT_1089819 [Armillaria gallica]|uniref:Peptidase C14 caspase domain-containing protein n=1 Tax=Armillaria gallica TaxID=47427 RepID=A0A2H3D5Z7_ARMGA|nr:hypothetical protein ARMGADRAFT_1089819 [Armillaria gallica]
MEIANISEELSRLEHLKVQLANEYGMKGDIDSVDFFDETKARAFSRGDVMSVGVFLLLKSRQYLQSPQVHHANTSQFSAVLIAIDEYPLNPLQGCVNDALLMERFLIEDLSVPKHKIQSLLGSKKAQAKYNDPTTPSCANIIEALTSLIYNTDINHGGNIIIYFSRHGSSLL